jgi:hypothetical protein
MKLKQTPTISIATYATPIQKWFLIFDCPPLSLPLSRKNRSWWLRRYDNINKYILWRWWCSVDREEIIILWSCLIILPSMMMWSPPKPNHNDDIIKW